MDKNRGAFEYDWRNRFGLALSSLPDGMDWGEAWRLTFILAHDPSSQVAAAVAGWKHPVTRDDMVLRDLFDLTHRANSKRKPKPYPRPWDREKNTYGRGSALSLDEYRALRARNGRR